jgi:hypothetical protein
MFFEEAQEMELAVPGNPGKLVDGQPPAGGIGDVLEDHLYDFRLAFRTIIVVFLANYILFYKFKKKQ